MENYFQALVGLIFFLSYVCYVSPKFNSWRGRMNALMFQGFLSPQCCHSPFLSLSTGRGQGHRVITPVFGAREKRFHLPDDEEDKATEGKQSQGLGSRAHPAQNQCSNASPWVQQD